MAREVERLTGEGRAGKHALTTETIMKMRKMFRINNLNTFLWSRIGLFYHSHSVITVGESLTQAYKILIQSISLKRRKDKAVAIISGVAQIRKIPGF
jgi:hypothetical protein